MLLLICDSRRTFVFNVHRTLCIILKVLTCDVQQIIESETRINKIYSHTYSKMKVINMNCLEIYFYELLQLLVNNIICVYCMNYVNTYEKSNLRIN